MYTWILIWANILMHYSAGIYMIVMKIVLDIKDAIEA